MKPPRSEFFQPYLLEPRSPKNQLAAELLIDELEAALLAEAEVRQNSYKGAKAIAHTLENLVLRHTNPSEWQAYLKHEVTRKSGQTKSLLEDILNWLHYRPGLPVAKALDKAAEELQGQYSRHKKDCPLKPDELNKIKQKLYPAALRAFLAQMMGRLTE